MVPPRPARCFSNRRKRYVLSVTNSDRTVFTTIHFPDATPPQEIVLMFVVVNHGRGIRTVVAALYVGPGIATMTPTPAQITSEATKIEPEDHK